VWRAAAVLAIVLVAGWTAFRFIAMPLLHQRIELALGDLGLPDPRFTIAELGTGHITLVDVTVGDSLRIGRIDATFDPATVADGKLETVLIEDARWRVDTAGGLSLSPFDTLKLTGGGEAGVGSVELRRGLVLVEAIDGLTTIPLDGRVKSTDAGYAVDLTGRWQGIDLTLKGEMTTGEREASFDVAIRGGIVSADVRGVHIDWTGEAIAVSVASVTSAELDARIDGLTLPNLAALREPGGTAALGIDAVRWRQVTWPDLQLRLARHAEPNRIEFTWPEQRIDRDHPLNGLLKELAGPGVTGVVSAKATMPLARSPTSPDAGPSLAVAVSDAVLQGPDDAYAVTGIQGALRLTGFNPLRTPGGQRLTWQGLRIGDVEFGLGAARVTLESPQSLLVEYLSTETPDAGRLWTTSFRFDPDAADLSTNLFLEGVAIGRWLPLLSRGNAAGSGRLFGRLPLRIQFEPRLRFAFGRGEVYAVGGGRLQIRNEKLIDHILAQQDQARDPQVMRALRQKLVQALQDFGFSKLSFVFTQEPEASGESEPVLRVHLLGDGEQQDPPMEFTVNFRGYQKAIDLILQQHLGLSGAGERGVRPSISF
jgi:hypothetical protein